MRFALAFIITLAVACVMFGAEPPKAAPKPVPVAPAAKTAVASPCGPLGCGIFGRSRSLSVNIHAERHVSTHDEHHGTGLVRVLFHRVADLVAGLAHRTACVAHAAFDARPRLVARVVHRVRVRCR